MTKMLISVWFFAVLFYLIFKSQNNIKYFYIAILTYIISLLFVSTTLLAGIVVSGTIIKVLVDDMSPVEYDQPLFLVDPN